MKFILVPPWRQSLLFACRSISAWAGKYLSLMGLCQVGHSCGFHGAQGHSGRAIKAPKMRFRVGKRHAFRFVFSRHFDLLIGGYLLRIAVGSQRGSRSEGSIVSSSNFFDRQLDRWLFDTAWSFFAMPIVATATRLHDLDKGYGLLANN